MRSLLPSLMTASHWHSRQTSVSTCLLCHQRALGEFPEKELQLQRMEVQAQRVFEKTSVDGRVHSLRDLKRLQESWLVLYNISLNLHG